MSASQDNLPNASEIKKAPKVKFSATWNFDTLGAL